MKLLKNKAFWLFIAVLVLAIPSFFRILRPGFFPMQDDMQTFRLYEMDRCVKDLQIPCRWIPDGGYQYGYPQFNFYAPLVYYKGELFHLLGFEFIDAIKILIVLGFLFSAAGMFILAREFFGDFPALAASVLYTYLPFKAQEVYVRGAISEFWAGLFFPFILWGLYKLVKNGGNGYFVVSAISIAGLFLTHNLLSFLFIPIALFWVAFWLTVEKKDVAWKKAGLAFLAGIGISSFFVLPMIAERGYVHIETLLGGYFDYRKHFVSMGQLFLSNHWGFGSSQIGPNDDLALSAGIIHWIFAAVAVIFAAVKFKKDKKISLLVLGLGSIGLALLFLMHEKSSFIWSAITPLKWLQFPWRFLSLTGFIFSFLSAYAVMNFGKAKNVVGILAISLVLILHAGFFSPQKWLNISDKEKLSGALWEKELTASIFDYLPIYAELPPKFKAPELPEVVDGKAEFSDYYKGSNYQTGKLKVEKDATIRLPVFDFPGMTVLLNGRKVNHVNNNCVKEDFCMGLISFNASKGEYDFRVELNNTPVRTAGNLISVLSLFAVAIILFKKNEKVS